MEKKITTYTCGGFTDLCRGGHLENPAKEIDPEAFKLDRVAGAYWRGDEKIKCLQEFMDWHLKPKQNSMLTSLNALRQKKEIIKNRQRIRFIYIFRFSRRRASPLHSKRNIGQKFTRRLCLGITQRRRLRKSRHSTHNQKELYETSGHWEKFKDDLFKINTREEHVFAMKPMNCPHHTQIYKRKQWSYKELPQRYAETTKVYRDEQTGELGGLARVRSITQDDAHVFCRLSQASFEMEKIYNIVKPFTALLAFLFKTSFIFA